ncbi:condensin complex protein MksE [Prevotella sp.]|mgnify:FL=1|uniref:condensin complex protein MksE n=1 Tax=Prevotella sp. TaxID=59823 RepID=UPI0030789E37
MRYTKEIFEILSRGGFISQNSISQQRAHLYDAIEDDFQQYQEYYEGIGFLLEGGNGYYYFSRTESKVELADKIQRMIGWIDRLDFLKTFNSTFGSGFSFRKSNILEKFSSDIELKEKARHLYTDLKTNDEKMDKLIADMERQGFIELENDLDGTYKVTAAFHYIEELIDCLTIIETEQE